MNTQTQIMLDIETLSTRPNAAIATIDAVAFTFNEGIKEDFYTNVDIANSVGCGGHVCIDTLKWWFKQPQEAIKEITKGTVYVGDALLALYAFIEKYGDVTVWANSPSFDLVILKNAVDHKALECDPLMPHDSGLLKAPWDFWNERDYRTYINTAESLGFVRDYTSKDVTHHALEDAYNQANELIRAHHFLHELKSKADDRDLIAVSAKGGEVCI